MPFAITTQTEILIWISIALILLIAEVFVGGLYMVPFSAGAGSAAIVAFASNWGIPIQVIVFCLVTLIMFFALRPLSERLAKGSDQKFNVDRLVGLPAQVTEAIDAGNGSGRVRVARELWPATSLQATVIPAGAAVIVQKVEGNHLVVAEPPPSS